MGQEKIKEKNLMKFFFIDFYSLVLLTLSQPDLS